MSYCDTINCGYYWREEGEAYPCCHYNDESYPAPCEYEDESEEY